MDSCDVLIVGGGPAGSACAWGLRRAGLDVRILDRRRFPRDKICGGWITPAVLEELEIDTADYARVRVLQPILAFRSGRIGGLEVETSYGSAVSYGIRRSEFDHYLAARSGARLLDGTPLEGLERSNSGWIANGRVRARVVVGAGGHFCPVARRLGARHGREPIVAAQEFEMELDARQQADCAVRGEVPELYFCNDLKGYGWCFRKGNVLNVGLGRLDARRLASHVAPFVDWLKRRGRIPRDFPGALDGHAYLLYGWSRRVLVEDAALVIGDAAGLAYPQSGEGIRPAVESGLLAARTILEAGGRYTRERLAGYERRLDARFGARGEPLMVLLSRRMPRRVTEAFGRRMLDFAWFTRRVVIDRWFLHRHEPPLNLS